VEELDLETANAVMRALMIISKAIKNYITLMVLRFAKTLVNSMI